MTAAPKIDVRDLRSVRSAARDPDLVLGDDDWGDGAVIGAGIVSVVIGLIAG